MQTYQLTPATVSAHIRAVAPGAQNMEIEVHTAPTSYGYQAFRGVGGIGPAPAGGGFDLEAYRLDRLWSTNKNAKSFALASIGLTLMAMLTGFQAILFVSGILAACATACAFDNWKWRTGVRGGFFAFRDWLSEPGSWLTSSIPTIGLNAPSPVPPAAIPAAAPRAAAALPASKTKRLAHDTGAGVTVPNTLPARPRERALAAR